MHILYKSIKLCYLCLAVTIIIIIIIIIIMEINLF